MREVQIECSLCGMCLNIYCSLARNENLNFTFELSELPSFCRFCGAVFDWSNKYKHTTIKIIAPPKAYHVKILPKIVLMGTEEYSEAWEAAQKEALQILELEESENKTND